MQDILSDVHSSASKVVFLDSLGHDALFSLGVEVADGTRLLPGQTVAFHAKRVSVVMFFSSFLLVLCLQRETNLLFFYPGLMGGPRVPPLGSRFLNVSGPH